MEVSYKVARKGGEDREGNKEKRGEIDGEMKKTREGGRERVFMKLGK